MEQDPKEIKISNPEENKSIVRNEEEKSNTEPCEYDNWHGEYSM